MLVLASESPRRRELLALAWPEFAVQAADIDEEKVQAASPQALAEELACQKAAAVAALRPGDTVIGCDTVVECEGRILGKPKDAQQAREMLRLLRGRTNRVHTGVAVFSGERRLRFVDSTTVWFNDITDGEIEAYIATDEPYDKAGGYGIQGWAAKHIPRIDGCYYNAMGLPVARLYREIKTNLSQI